MLDVAPPDLVAAAASAGFDFVGLRTATTGPGEESWGLEPGSAMTRRTLEVLADTGLQVLDVDILPIRRTTSAAAYEPAMETAAQLGARYFNVLVDDDDLARATDVLAGLVPVAAAHGLRLLVEPMVYKQVRSLPQAVDFVGGAPGSGIMIDPLHFRRYRGDLAEVRSLDPSLFPYLQICDAPLEAPHDLPQPESLPRGQAAGVSPAQLEARAWRLPPGEGELPLGELLAAVPDVPVAIEAPNLYLSATLSPQDLARRLKDGLDAVLAGSASPHGRWTWDSVSV